MANRNVNNMRVSLLAGVSLVAGLLVSVPAFAQNAEADSAATTEIVVTAQRKEEKLSRVPLTVQAYSGEALKSKVIVSEQDMGTLVPGLQVKNGQTSSMLSFSMRGQTLDPFSGTSPAVLTYLNEAPYSPYNTATSFFDLSSAQVLKGPQGTLFGRNATGGAVLYGTTMPGDVVGGNAIVRAGERGTIQVQAAIDLPLVEDKLQIRLAGDFSKQKGYITNVASGNTLGDTDSQSGRLTIVMKPGEGVKNTTVVQYSHFGGTEGAGNLYNYYTTPDAQGRQYIKNGDTTVLNTTGSSLTSILALVYGNVGITTANGCPAGDSNVPAAGCTTGEMAPGRWPGGVEGYAKWSRANPYKTWLQYDLPHEAHATFVSNTTEVEIGDSAKIKNIFSYSNSVSRITGNLANAPFGALWLFSAQELAKYNGVGIPGRERFDATTYSDELQVQGKALDDKLDYTVGAFYLNGKRTDYVPVLVGADLAAPLGGITFHARNSNISKAMFAQLSYKLADNLTATLGGRYTWETLRIIQLESSGFGPGSPQEKKISAPSWTASLQYQISPSSMIYFAQRGSFRTGNFNPTVFNGGNTNYFDTEKTYDFEIGYKFSGRVSGMPVRFNLAAYDQHVKKAQHAIYLLTAAGPVGFTVNVPKARSTGVEIDASVAPTNWLTISATGSYNNSRYTNGLVDTTAQQGSPTQVFTSFNSYPDAPKWSDTVSLDVTLPTSQDFGTVILHGDVYSQSKTFFSSNNGSVTPGTELPGYTTANVRLSWKNILKSNVSAGVYVKNLADKLYYISGYAMGAAGGYNTAYPGAPRTVGGEISVNF